MEEVIMSEKFQYLMFCIGIMTSTVFIIYIVLEFEKFLIKNISKVVGKIFLYGFMFFSLYLGIKIILSI